MVSLRMTHGNIVQYLKVHPKDYDIIGDLVSVLSIIGKYLSKIHQATLKEVQGTCLSNERFANLLFGQSLCWNLPTEAPVD
jgi:hypothetical protein